MYRRKPFWVSDSFPDSEEYAEHNRRYFLKHYGLSTAIKRTFWLRYWDLRMGLARRGVESVVHTDNGDLITIPDDRGISQELRLFKVHEPLVTDLLKHELKEGMICIDIGANIGYYTLLERKIAGHGAVFAIEPSPKTISFLKRNLELNNFPDVPVFSYAMSDIDGYASFLMAGQSNASRVVEAGGSVDQTIKVQAKRLDTFLKENRIENFDFLRMDTEGHEAAIYRGGRDAIRNMMPSLLVEFHKREIGGRDKTVNLLLQMKEDGYEVRYFIPREVDISWVCSEHFVEKLSINEIIQKVQEDKTPNCFHLFLANQHRKAPGHS